MNDKVKKAKRNKNLRRSREAAKHPSRNVAIKKKPGRRPGATSKLAEEFKSTEVDSEMVRRYLTTQFHKPIEELRRLFASETLEFGEASIVSVMLRIYDTGDIYALNALYDRMIGPILRRYQITGERPFQDWTIEALLEEKKRLAELNRNTIDMIHKEKRLIAAVEAGEIKPGEYTGYAPRDITNDPPPSGSSEAGPSKTGTG